MFGCIAWNPILMVPMWLQGIILPIIIYVLTKVIPLFPIPDILFNMWYCPFPICTSVSYTHLAAFAGPPEGRTQERGAA